jgi:hypothetical protein
MKRLVGLVSTQSASCSSEVVHTSKGLLTRHRRTNIGVQTRQRFHGLVEARAKLVLSQT